MSSTTYAEPTPYELSLQLRKAAYRIAKQLADPNHDDKKLLDSRADAVEKLSSAYRNVIRSLRE